MPDLFISYSRKDTAFVRTLYDSLVNEGLEVWVDWQDIPPIVAWWETIAQGIEESNAFVFVISPNSLASPVCHLEINYAIAHNKRLIPIVRMTVDENTAFADLISKKLEGHIEATLAERDLMSVARQNWQEIARHNWLFFIEDATFDSRLKVLVDTVNTDYDYLQQHTRLLVRAREWEKRGHSNAFLLRDTELKEAEQWLDHAQKNTLEPEPGDLHKEYIRRSRAHTARLRRMRTIVAAVLPMVGLLTGAFAIWQVTQQPEIPVKMDGLFNIAIAPVYEMNNGRIDINDHTEVLTQKIYDAIESEANLVDGFEENEIQVVLAKADPVESEQDAAAIIEDYNAHIIIYAVLNANQGTFSPYFYYDPNLVGISEITGESAFGAPIENFPVSINGSLGSQSQLTKIGFDNRVKLLAQFLYGVGAFQWENYPVTLHYFNLALKNEDWNDHEGKKILYLWIGTLFDRSFANKIPEGGLECPPMFQSANAPNSALDCAANAYNRAITAAQSENESAPFARAYLGLGNVYHSSAKALPDVEICDYYMLAIDEFDKAQQIDQEIEGAPTLTSVKAHFNAGAAYYAFVECVGENDPTMLSEAAANFESAATIADGLEPTNEVKALAAEAWFRLGVVSTMLQDVNKALNSYDRAIAITNPPEKDLAREPAWKDIRYLAMARKANVYRQIAINEGDSSYWERIIKETKDVVDAYFVTGAFTDDQAVLNTLYYRGLAYEAMNQPDNACESYRKARDIGLGNPPLAHFDDVRGRLTSLKECEQSEGA